MFEGYFRGTDFLRRKTVKHERVVGIRAMRAHDFRRERSRHRGGQNLQYGMAAREPTVFRSGRGKAAIGYDEWHGRWLFAPLPTTLETLGNRRFAFYPPILSIQRNEWLFRQATWSELLVVNAQSGCEVCIPRRFLGEVSRIEEPTLIVGLTKELEYRDGAVWPHRSPRHRDADRCRGGKSERPRDRKGPAAVVRISLHSREDTGKSRACCERGGHRRRGRACRGRGGRPIARPDSHARACPNVSYRDLRPGDDAEHGGAHPGVQPWKIGTPTAGQLRLPYPRRGYTVVLSGRSRELRAILWRDSLLHAPSSMKKALGSFSGSASPCSRRFCLGAIALNRGEHINSLWLVVASACTYLIGYRFYAKFIAARVMALDDQRATPAERLRNGHDYEPTNKWIVFGHHFAAIAGPGPLVGPGAGRAVRLSAGNAVDHHRRGAGRRGAGLRHPVSLPCGATENRSAQMAREEIGKVGGFVALLTVLLIMVILLAVVALVVVNALVGSPWGTFHHSPRPCRSRCSWAFICALCGPARCWNVRRSDSCWCWRASSAANGCRQSSCWRRLFTFPAMALAWAIIVYGFLASALPVWLLLAPRDYLSTFVKLGVIFLLALRHFAGAAGSADARLDALRGRHRTRVRGQDLPVLLHHHRVRSDFRIPFADFFRHHAENARARNRTPGRSAMARCCSKALSPSWP